MNVLPRVALVGRPNVGKSTLFNRLIGMRLAVVADIAGTTRDRLERTITYNNKAFTLVDMAGLEPALKEKTEIRQGMQKQVELALQSASLIVWVVDGLEGLQPEDEIVAELLRRLGKPVVVAANKCDADKHEAGQYEFSQFGFEEIVPISALHARGIENLFTAISSRLPEEGIAQENERELRLAIVGRPNVGKSTLLNALANEYRSVVSAEGGTTRDAVDVILPASALFNNTFTQWEQVRVVDTAGIRRRGKIDRSIEGWSVLRSYDAIDQAEVALFVIDGSERLVAQDLQVAQRLVDAGKPLILVINKWDAVLEKKGFFPGTPEDDEYQESYLTSLRAKMPFLHWVQVLFLSAQKHINLDVIGKLVINAYKAWNISIDQDELDSLTAELKKMPRLQDLKSIEYMHSKPPVFHIHVKTSEIPHFSTRRYIENAIRDFFEIGPTPIKLWVEAKERKRRF